MESSINVKNFKKVSNFTFLIKVACMVQIWEKTFCQNSHNFGYNFVKNDVTFMYLLCIYKKTHILKPI